MNILILFLCLIPLSFGDVPFPKAATGVELGVARLAGKGESLIGTSWVYHFEYQADHFLTVIAQAGQSSGQENDVKMSQTSFGGGVEFELLPVLGLRLGVATTIIELDTNSSSIEEQELGPFAGLTMKVTDGIFKFGTSATVMRTDTIHSLALRCFGLIEF